MASSLGVLVLGLAAWGFLRAPAAQRSAVPPTKASAAVPSRMPERLGAAPLTRDLLRYEASPEPTAVSPPDERPSLPVPPPPFSSPPPTERLVGFVRRGGQLFAALNLPTGETVVWSVGPQTAGYELLTIDEERGARLRRPDGTDVTLHMP